MSRLNVRIGCNLEFEKLGTMTQIQYACFLCQTEGLTRRKKATYSNRVIQQNEFRHHRQQLA